MSATDDLLTLLKEHWVEHYEHEAPATDCIAFFDGEGWHDCWESVDGEVNVTFSMTPEQAIAATLGPGTCHPKPQEKWTTVLLPEIAWSWDDSWPDYLSVAHDTHGEWRTYVPEATLGSCNCSDNCTNSERTGTCRNTAPSYLDFLCSECGFVHYHSDENDSGDGNEWHYCPNCGRRIEQ